MNFDEIGKQHVLKRAMPSPVRDKRYSTFSVDTDFSRKASPRSGRARAGFELFGLPLFGRKTRASKQRAAGAASGGGYGTHHRFSSPNFSPATLKTAAVFALIAGGMITALSLSGMSANTRQAVTPESLEDPAGVMERKLASVDQIMVDDFGFMSVPNPPASNQSEIFPDIPSANPAPPSPVTEVSSAAEIPVTVTVPVTPEATGTPSAAWAVQYAETTLNVTDTFNWTEYTVRQGDTTSGIAEKYPVSLQTIVAYNNMEKAWLLQEGQVLKIPNIDGIPYTVVKNDNLFKIAQKMDVPQNAILDANDLRSDIIKPGEVLFIPGAKMNAAKFRTSLTMRSPERPMIFPIPGKITSGYGWRINPVQPKTGISRFHYGVDLLGNTGDPVKAVMDGKVENLANNSVFGNFIILDHGVYKSMYAHLSAYSVRVGETVEQGHKIGEVGNTGISTGPHLHLEVYKQGNRVNPLELLK